MSLQTMSGRPQVPKGKEQAIVDFEEMRAFWEGVTRIQGIKVLPAPNGLKTFAFDLEKKCVYASDLFGEDKNGKAKNSFGLGHELGHLEEALEVFDIPSEQGKPSGIDFFEKVYLPRIRRDRAFALADNCFADIAINHKLTKKVPTMSEIELSIGQENLFPSDDMTQVVDTKTSQTHPVPLHIQLPQALLVETRYRPKGHQVKVNSQVRHALDRIKGQKINGRSIVDVIQNENIDMYTRYLILQKYIMPEVENLKEEDMKNNTKNPNEQTSNGEREDGQQGEPEQSGGQQGKEDGEPQDGQGGKGQGKDAKQKRKSLKDRIFGGGKGDKKTGPEKSEQQQPSQQPGQESGQEKTNGKLHNKNPNQIFAEDYKRAEAKTIPTTPLEDLEKTFRKWKQEFGDPVKRAQKMKAESLGVKTEDLIDYSERSRRLELLDEKDGEKSLGALIRKIVVERTREKLDEKGYVSVPEGDEIAPEMLGQLYSDFKAGNLNSQVSVVHTITESKGHLCGEIRLTLIGDRSGSMNDPAGDGKIKLDHLQDVITWGMNSQKNLQDEIRSGENNSAGGLLKGLDVKWEIYSFQSSNQDVIPVVPMTDIFSERDRINAVAHFNNAPRTATTTDFNSLGAILKTVESDQETLTKIKEKELKKVVLLVTDGDSDNVPLTQSIVLKLTELGVVVIIIGVGEGARNTEINFPKNGVWVSEISNLLPTMTDKLKGEFKDLLPLK